MKVYRVSATKYATDITGEGARLYGGRWNHPLTACIYSSESRALAILEYSVNVNIKEIPRALSIVTFSIAADEVKEILLENLPGNWAAMPAPNSTKDMGTALLKAYSILKIPSVVIPLEHNYIINPLAQAAALKILDVQDLVYDVRIK